MKIDSHIAEKYILIACMTHKFEDVTIRTKFLRVGIMSCLLSVIFFVLALVVHIYSNLRESISLIAIFTILLLIPIVVFISSKEQSYMVKKYSNMTATQIYKYKTKFRVPTHLVFIVIAMLIVILNPVIAFLAETMAELILVGGGFLLLYLAYEDFYLVYLQKKYCDYLNVPEDRRYNMDLTLSIHKS